MSLLSEFNTYFDIRIVTVGCRSFVRFQFKFSYGQFNEVGDVDNAVRKAMQMHGIMALIAPEPVETKCRLKNVKGILFLRNIIF